MNDKIPNSVIGAVASVIAEDYFSHSKLNMLFMEAGAPGEVPEGNCEQKCSTWLKRCNENPSTEALEVLGAVIQAYMDKELTGNSSKLKRGQERITSALARNQLSYRTNGYITPAGSSAISKTVEDYLKSGDFSSIEKEFERAIEHINTDPHASITAACSIIEAALKFYIETFNLTMPRQLNVMPLWRVVQPHLGLNSDPILADDQHKVIKGISSIIDGIGAFRSHIGSAHGRGIISPSIVVAEARLVVNSSHTIVVFVLELLHAKKA